MVEFPPGDILVHLLLAARWTVLLSFIALLGGGGLALILLISRIVAPRVGGRFVGLYVYLFQGTPLLMQLFLVYFGLSLLEYDVSAWVSATASLTLYTSAFLTEIWHGSVTSVSKGQWEAATSQAMSLTVQLRYVVLPQALPIAIPPTVGFVVQAIKATALTSIIGFVELTKAGMMISNASFKPFFVFGAVALIYFALCCPVSLFCRSLETRLICKGSALNTVSGRADSRTGRIARGIP
jgi:polar amino acid transport system permease protein